MIREPLNRRAVLVAAAACFWAGCDTADPPVPTTVSISPTSAAFRSIGESVRMIATVSDQYGQAMANVTVTWNSSDTAVATVTRGLVTAVGNGSATVTATTGSVTASVGVAVDQLVAVLAVSPTAHTLVAIGDTVRLVAEARDGNGHVVAGAEFAWLSDNESVVTVDAEGLATAAANGSARVTARSGSQTADAEVSVEQDVAEVSVSPPLTVLEALDDTVRLSADATDANGHPVGGTAFAWTSSNALVAVVDSIGLVTAVGNGQAKITAAAGTASETAVVTVAQQPGSVVVSPATDTLVAFGDTVRLSAEAMDANGHVVSGTAFTWVSGDTLVAVVEDTGLVMAVGNGVTTVTAASGGALGDAMVTVLQSADSVIVTPSADSVALGDTLSFSAEALDANGHAVVGANFRWSSSDASVAPVDAGGQAYGFAEGAATISAVAGSAQGTAQIIVFNPDRAALVALYEATDGPNWVNNENWLTDAALRDWYGVSTGDRVVQLVLSGNGLVGALPPELGKLTNLRGLYLDNNALSGSIPPELGDLKNLRFLHVTANPDLRGEMPPEILAMNLDSFESSATSLCVPRTGDFESYVSRRGWSGYACGETEPGFQIQLVFHPEVPDYIREVMNSQAEYWMEILRETEAPDMFGHSVCSHANWRPSLPHAVIDDIVVTVRFGGRITGASYCGSDDILRHRIMYNSKVLFGSRFSRELWKASPGHVELVARHELGHTLGISALWHVRDLIRNPSTEEARDTYVISPLAMAAFDAAGGTSYTGPKVPLHQHGGGRNGHWRTEVFGSELMSWGWNDYVPTSAVTLQALADLGYEVDLSLADPYTLPRTATAAALGADEPTLELGWEAPPTVVVCRPQDDPLRELEILRPGLRLHHARFRPCQSAQATSSSSRSFTLPTPKTLPSKIQLPPSPDS